MNPKREEITSKKSGKRFHRPSGTGIWAIVEAVEPRNRIHQTDLRIHPNNLIPQQLDAVLIWAVGATRPERTSPTALIRDRSAQQTAVTYQTSVHHWKSAT